MRTGSGTEGERHASWLELFFDLVFVVAIAELAHELVVDHSLAGFARFAALFVPVFIAWQGFSLYADRFDTDDVVFRACMLAAMLAIATLAVQIPHVAAGGSGGFAAAYVVLRALTVGLNLRAYRAVPAARPLIGRYARGSSVSLLLWTASLAVAEPWRYVLWGVGLAFDLAMWVVSGRLIRRTPIHASHVPERFALFTIIVLGESVVAVALGTAASEWRVGSAIAAAVGFLIVACLWWIYFDVGAAIALPAGSTGVRFAYAHLPLLAAITAVAAGVDLLIEESGAAHLSAGARWALGGGTAVYLTAVSLAHRETARGVPGPVVRARLILVPALGALALVGARLDPVAFGAPLLALLVALVVFEIARNRSFDQPVAAVVEGS